MFLSLSTDAQTEHVAGVLTELGVWSKTLEDQSGRVTGFWVEAASRPVSRSDLLSIDGVSGVSQPKAAHPFVDRAASRTGILDAVDNACTLMAGPCAAESEESLHQIAASVRKCGGRFLRGGAFKPRTSPHAFAGYG